jgi:hypothetical protein
MGQFLSVLEADPEPCDVMPCLGGARGPVSFSESRPSPWNARSEPASRSLCDRYPPPVRLVVSVPPLYCQWCVSCPLPRASTSKRTHQETGEGISWAILLGSFIPTSICTTGLSDEEEAILAESFRPGSSNQGLRCPLGSHWGRLIGQPRHSLK